MSQDFFRFDKSKPHFMRELDGEEARPIKKPAPRPPGAKKKPMFTHYALVRLNDPQPKSPPRLRRPSPPICEACNLPSFESIKAGEDFLNCYRPATDFHRTRTLAQWQCKSCSKYHIWTCGSHTDSNGGKVAGSDNIPIHVQRLIELYAIKTTTAAA